MLDNPHSGHAFADDFSHFSVVELLDETEHYHLALLISQSEHRRTDALLICRLLQRVLGIAVELLVDVSLVELAVVPFRPKEADGQVVSNAQQPGCKGRAALFVAVDGFPGLEESLGREILGFPGVVYKVVDMSIHADDVTVVEIG